MIKILLRIVGLLLIVGAAAAAWNGFEKVDEIRRKEQSVYVQLSQNAYGGHGESPEVGKKKITEFEDEIEAKKSERNIWFGAAAVALVAGLGIALAPLSGKRKVSVAQQAPAQNQDAPSV